jgi:hypothetical protein
VYSLNPKRPKIYADYNKYDEKFRLILTCFGTFNDLQELGIDLVPGQEYTFYMDSDVDEFGNPDNLLVDGYVEFDHESNRWVATIDESTYRHESEETRHQQ